MVSNSRCSTTSSARLLLTVLTGVALLGAGEATGAQLTASWVDNSNGVATTRVERRLGTDTVYSAVADVPPGTTTYVDASLSAGTTYCYRAFAYDSAGASSYSNEACATSASSGSSNLNVTVGKAGNGTGLVTSTPASISCDPTCSATYVTGTSVTLAATPSPGSRFSGWSGGGCAGTASCTIAGNGALTVTASFNLTTISTDTTPPTVTLVLPSSLIARRSAVTLSATASDNIGVVKVEFYVNGSLQCSDTASPYTCVWRVPAANKSYVLQAKAYDAAGNVGVSPRVTVAPQ
jgi:Bacterial Ig domain/Divergent InlB B-repeat domain